jgi:high frequency lysogenization protein
MNNNDRLYNSTLALAGILQAVSLVKQIAFTGQCEQEPFKTSINSIYITEPEDVASVYVGTEFLQLGLEKLINILSASKNSPDADLVRYVLGLIYLERKLTRNTKLMAVMLERITKAKQQLSFFEATHTNALANLADIYFNTISTFNWRIQVIGKQELITQPDILNKIRALLLAGIRSTVLWRQTGGTRLQLLLKRRQILAMAQRILSESQS